MKYMAAIIVCMAFASFGVERVFCVEQRREMPLAVSFTHGVNGAPRNAIYVAGEVVYMKAVAKEYPIPKSRLCTLSVRYYIVDKSDRIAYSHRIDKITTAIAIGHTSVKLLLECPVNSRLDPGEYNFVTEMKDAETGQVFRNRQSFLVLPWDEFAVSQLCFSSMTDPVVMLGPSFEVGQKVLLHLVIQSPQADIEGNWHLGCKIRLFNKAGESIDRRQELITEKVPSTSRGVVPASGRINISVAGDYVAVVEVKDLVSGNVVKKSIPFRVFDSLKGIPRAPTL